MSIRGYMRAVRSYHDSHPEFRRCVWQLAFLRRAATRRVLHGPHARGPDAPGVACRAGQARVPGQHRVSHLSLLKRKNAQLGGPQCKVTVGATLPNVLCGVSAYEEYIEARQAAGEVVGPDSLLFPCWNAKDELHEELRYAEALEWLRKDLSKAGLPAELFGLHSFRKRCCDQRDAQWRERILAHFAGRVEQ